LNAHSTAARIGRRLRKTKENKYRQNQVGFKNAPNDIPEEQQQQEKKKRVTLEVVLIGDEDSLQRLTMHNNIVSFSRLILLKEPTL
jgi:hypothetical protein